MRKYKKVLKNELEDIICDICSKSCLDEGFPDIGLAEFATIEANWGYLSKKDGECFSWEICEKCFDKVKVFMDSLR